MKKILVIDDEKMILSNAEHILSSKYMVFTAQSAEDGMRIYEEEMPDLVLLDIHMPGMDGFDLQDALNARYSKKIPIIFMTGDDNREMEGTGLNRGAEDFIHKPFLPDVLLSRLEKTHAHHARPGWHLVQTPHRLDHQRLQPCAPQLQR